MFAYARMARVKNMAGLKNADRHGRRLDASSKRRSDPAKTANNLVWSNSDDPLDVVGAYKKRKADTGATEYKGASLALHFLVGVSPAWLAETGDVHDPKNPRNVQLFAEAKKWADATFGDGSTIAARLDLDEAGSGVVDLVVVPVAESKRRGKTKTLVSVNKGLERAWGKCKSYSALQDSWAQHAQKTLSPDLQRGKPKEETQREHVHADIYRPTVQKAQREAEAIQRQAVEQWSDVSDWPWRDREKVVAVARDVGVKEGAAAMKKKAVVAIRKQKEKAEKEKIDALESKDKEWSVKVSAVQSEVESVRVNLGAIVEERDALALEVDALRSENEGLKSEVSLLRRVVSAVYERAPEPVRRFINALTRKQTPDFAGRDGDRGMSGSSP